MRKLVEITLLTSAIAGLAFGSVIDSFTPTLDASTTVSYSTDAATEASMAGGLEITAFFSSGLASATCLWTDVAQPGDNCLSSGDFGVRFSNGSDDESLNTHPLSLDNNGGFWTITNLRTAADAITSIVFNGLTNIDVGGLGVAFDRCILSGGAFDDTEPLDNCYLGQVGTVGSAEGYSAGDHAGGTTAATGAATVSSRLDVDGTPVNDAFGVMTIAFSGTFGSLESFTFLADADLIDLPEPPPGGEVPEPATLGLMGFGLVALGLVRHRRRRNAQ